MVLKRMPLRRIIRVDWEDSASGGGWNRLDDFKDRHGTLSCQSVGYVAKSDKDVVMLVQSVCENGDVNDSISIPRKCIKRVRRIGT